MTTRRRSPSLLRSLLRAILMAPVTAVPFALFFGTLYGASLGDYLRAYRVSVVFATSIGVAMWVVRWFVVPRLASTPESTDDARGWTYAVAYSAGAIVASYVAATVVHFTILPGFLGSPRSIAISGMWTLLFVGLFSGINSAIAFYRIAVSRARAVERLRAELAEAEVRALRAQIQPHFLFNTLNSIAALVRIDPPAAEETITRLADVFRYALRASERSHARLAEELEFLRDYLAIERVRFGDRLQIEEHVDAGLDAVSVPTLLLQPIVENAIRHGVGPRPEGGRVSVVVRDALDTVVVEIADDGVGMSESAPLGEGFGLHSVRERLRASGPPHALDIVSSRSRGTRVRITLPKAPATSALPVSPSASPLPESPSSSLPKSPSASSIHDTPSASSPGAPPASPSRTPPASTKGSSS